MKHEKVRVFEAVVKKHNKVVSHRMFTDRLKAERYARESVIDPSYTSTVYPMYTLKEFIKEN